MSQQLSFEKWKAQVLAGVAPFKHLLDMDEDLLFMAYDMEDISVEKAIAEYTIAAQKIMDNGNRELLSSRLCSL